MTKLSILANPYVFVEGNKKLVQSIKISNKTYIILGKSVYESVFQNDKATNRFVCFSQEIKDKLPAIYESLKLGKRSFNLKEAESLAKKFGFNTCCDLTHNKGDIVLKFEENNNYALSTQESVSLKSFLGDNPSLLNASKYSTRITYKINNLTEETIQLLQSKNYKARENIQQLIKLGANLKQYSFAEAMQKNVDYLDASNELAYTVLMHFAKEEKQVSSLAYLEQQMNKSVQTSFIFDNFKNNTVTLDYPNYKQALKRILKASLLGMNPSEEWDGIAKTSENLLLAMPDMTCKMLKGGESIESYLYDNCYIDTPSQSKHGYGKIYQVGSDWYIDLNFQIRVKK